MVIDLNVKNEAIPILKANTMNSFISLGMRKAFLNKTFALQIKAKQETGRKYL